MNATEPNRKRNVSPDRAHVPRGGGAETLFGGTLRVYGSRISYFTGKLEAYLRYRGIPYERIAMTPARRAAVAKHTGTPQMPAVELPRPHPRGSWLTDTTPTIAFIEEELAKRGTPGFIPLRPVDPLLGFVAALIEDHGDEWLWRPAMHYRWSHRRDRVLLSDTIVDEMLGPIPAPAQLKRWAIRFRQWFFYVRRDGVNSRTREAVEGVYLRTLDALEEPLRERPFVLGERPTAADYGLCGSLFRHFSSDPTPAEIMRSRTPSVWEWVARIWNVRDTHCAGVAPRSVPGDLAALFAEISRNALPALAANAEAFARARSRHTIEIDGTPLDVPTSRYRVWCLERLSAALAALDERERAAAQALLADGPGWDILTQPLERTSGLDPDDEAPFAKGHLVYTRG